MTMTPRCRFRFFCFSVSSLLGCSAATTTRPADVEAAPLSYEEWVRAATAQTESGRAERAARIAEGAVRSQPQRPEAYAIWGRALAQLGNLSASTEKYEAALARGAHGRDVYLELAGVYDVVRRYDDALRVYGAYLNLEPNDAEVHQQLGLTLILREKYADAVLHLRAAMTLKPDDLQIAEDYGLALLRAGNLADAEKVLSDVLTAAPSHVPALRFAAEASAGLGHIEAALNCANRALAADAKDSDTRRLRARLLILGGQADKALEDFSILLRDHPDDPRLRLGAAGALLLDGRLDEAEAHLHAVKGALAGNPQLRFRELQLALRHGDAKAFNALVDLAQSQESSLEIWQEVARQAKARHNAKWQKAAEERLKALGQ
jgi:Flp pilus assembly protein TadD